ncbi:helix-turn-helix domain-containing protein [Halalkalicoccus ordinarius]|uniref:helix-turn-helix domain-containing protein n=1 Tax=Halalkalicoccus ordinarius TaxID=3116651 RepID=UPI00300EB79D
MSVIAELQIAGSEFALGRTLEAVSGTAIELENMVPMGESPVPFFWVHNSDCEEIEANLSNQETVQKITEIDNLNGRTLYALEWTIDQDELFRGIQEQHAQVLGATGTIVDWEFELRFPSHEALSDFQRYCKQEQIEISVRRIYNPTKPGTGPWFGLTPMQRETLLLATEMGYYNIPRECSTIDLAERLEISDQAVTERLRRAIVTLVSNTLHEEQTTPIQDVNESQT